MSESARSSGGFFKISTILICNRFGRSIVSRMKVFRFIFARFTATICSSFIGLEDVFLKRVGEFILKQTDLHFKTYW